MADQRETQTLLTAALHVLADFYGRKSGNTQSMGHVECGKIYGISFPPAELNLFHGPFLQRVRHVVTRGHGAIDGGLVVGTIIKLKLGLQPKLFEPQAPPSYI